MEKHLINLDQIEHLAELSGFNFTDKEKNLMVKEVSGILNMLKRCEDVQLIEKSNPKIVALSELREDIINPSIKKDNAIGQAVNTRGDYVAIPKVVD